MLLVSTCRRIEALMHESQAAFTSEAHYCSIAAEQSLVSMALQQIRVNALESCTFQQRKSQAVVLQLQVSMQALLALFCLTAARGLRCWSLSSTFGAFAVQAWLMTYVMAQVLRGSVRLDAQRSPAALRRPERHGGSPRSTGLAWGSVRLGSGQLAGRPGYDMIWFQLRTLG